MKIFLLLVLLSFAAQAQNLYYLRHDSIDLSMVPLPPVENSAEDLADLEEVIRIQGIRTEADCKKAGIEAEGFATSFFGSSYGPLTEEEAAKLVDFQERLFDEAMYFSRQLKDRFARVRPYNRTERVKPCIKTHRSLSYPSGHATIAVLAAKSFAMIYPDKKEAFYQRAEEIAWGRVVGGVHHPLDTIAGKVMGELLFEALVKEEAFITDLENLKK